METAPGPWIAALRSSHERLRTCVETLGTDDVEQPSYDSEWSIAQVLSHLGSQAEIFGLFLNAGLSGGDPPGGDAFGPIWEAWNTRSPQSQVADSLQAGNALVERFESLNDGELGRLHLQLFGMEIDATALARMRLSEHAVHTWDVAVALDAAAKVAPDAVDLLVDTLDVPAGRSGKADGEARRIHVTTSEPERHFVLETGDAVTLVAGEPADAESPADAGSEVRLPAEAFLRLVYGRLDPDHTPPVSPQDVELGTLRAMFPGF
ncbi:MAG: maleylpyruvate isomerase family mycothiol-dependent enzyme [Acidimicrobiales bacterium]|jgi:uncharacterized protein (TIGR03083 family)